MATKRFIIEVEEGHTECMKCPLRVTSKICSNVECAKFNLVTMKIKEYDNTSEGKALLYAVEKTAERTKKEIVNKACEWLCKNMTDSAYLGANTLLPFHKAEFIEQFKKAMEES